MMGEGMAPYADTEHRRGLFGIGEHKPKPDAETSAAGEASTAPELSPTAEVSPVAGDSGSENDVNTGVAEAAVIGSSTSVESPDMATNTNVDTLAGSPEGTAPINLGDAAAEPGVGATETPDVTSDTPPASENVVTPLTPAEDLLGEVASGSSDVASESGATSADISVATSESPATDDATSTLDAMRAEEAAGASDVSLTDADGKEKPSILDDSIPVSEGKLIDDAMGDLLKAQDAKADPVAATEEPASGSDVSPSSSEVATQAEAPTITATTSEITTPASTEAATDTFPELKSDDTDPAANSADTVSAPTVPESPLTLVNEAPSTDSTEASTTDVSEEETPGANEAVAEELASTPVTESTAPDMEVAPAATEATLASVADIAHKLSAADKARLIAELAGDMEQAA